MNLGTTKDIKYIVQYTDHKLDVEGPVKTRICDNMEQASRINEDIIKYRPDITDLVIVKQETTQKRTQVG